MLLCCSALASHDIVPFCFAGVTCAPFESLLLADSVTGCVGATATCAGVLQCAART